MCIFMCAGRDLNHLDFEIRKEPLHYNKLSSDATGSSSHSASPLLSGEYCCQSSLMLLANYSPYGC